MHKKSAIVILLVFNILLITVIDMLVVGYRYIVQGDRANRFN